MNILLLFGTLSSGVFTDDRTNAFLNPMKVEATTPISDDIVKINEDIPYFTDEDFTSTEVYHESGPLDALGRVTEANAVVGVEIMPAEERGNIGQFEPTGWNQASYANIGSGGWLYNRSHLIGHQLTGNDDYENLMTGTRWFNIRMLEYENFIADYVEETENHVRYRITPIFEGDNLVASGIYMEGYSIEDFGEGLMFNIFVPNVQTGVEINYADGTSIGPAGPPENGTISEEVTTLQFLTKAQNLPSVSAISKMPKDQLAKIQVEIDQANDLYDKLTKSAKEDASVMKWSGYVAVKEAAVKDALSYNAENFLTDARALPSVSAIKKMDPAQLVTLQEKIDRIQNAYNNLPEATKKGSEVAKWSGYVTAKKKALNETLIIRGNAFVAEVRKLPSVSAIGNMNTSQLTSLNKRVQAAQRTYNALPGGIQKQSQVVLWSGYLSAKDSAVSKSFNSPSNQFVKQAKGLPSISDIRKLSRVNLLTLNTRLKNTRKSYNSLSSIAKGDAEVKKWEGYVKLKETETAKLLASKPVQPTRGLIKGNINSKGEKIYHVPGGASYSKTVINEAAGERWFRTEAEAKAAGWRKSLR